MKNLNTKSLMVITIVIASVFTMPMAVMGQENDQGEVFNFDQVDAGIFQGFMGGFGGIFSNNLGYAGSILGTVFETILMQGLDINSYQILESVYVLNATTTREISDVKEFTDENNKEYYHLPNEYEVPDKQGFAYCEITKTGSYSYDLEVGAAVTLIIWDSDKSFINAITRLLSVVRKIIGLQSLGRQISLDLIREGISVLTWFLIHINDIFTGDELFVLNPITWQKVNMTPISYEITKEWMLTGPDYKIGGVDPDIPVNDTYGTYLADWEINASTWQDSYMEWLLDPIAPGILPETIWTQFSFDLIQLWIKNFEIHIDVAEILNAATGAAGSPEQAIASAFGGCDIEFYLFTHHLAGAFLYNDTNPTDGKISADYVNVTNDIGETVFDEAGDPMQVPDRSELSHRLILGTVGNFDFNTPKPNEVDNSISWGITLNNVNISAVPMFVDLDSYFKGPEEELASIYFGFTFEPTIDEEFGVAKGIVKLDQEFAPWNRGVGPNAYIPGLDLAIIYVSTVLHFHLNVAVEGIPDPPEEILDPEEDYIEESHELKVGNYIGRRASQKLDFVDIAGEYYQYGTDKSTAPQYNASTNILPLALWKWEMERHDTFELGDGTESETFASDIRVTTEFNVMVYAICYPEFEDNALGVYHDPTFSVYMVFESEGFWALIVLIAGVGLVGVATVLITRRKNRRF